MAGWLRRRYLSDMKCTVRDLEVMGSNLDWVKLRMRSTSVQVVLEPKISSASASAYGETVDLKSRHTSKKM